MKTNYKHTELTEKIIGAAYNAYNTLGSGLLESVYKNAMGIERVKTELELESGSIRSLLRELRRRYPDIPENIEDELAISIDGVLHQDDWFAKIEPDSEVHLLPRIAGG